MWSRLSRRTGVSTNQRSARSLARRAAMTRSSRPVQTSAVDTPAPPEKPDPSTGTARYRLRSEKAARPGRVSMDAMVIEYVLHDVAVRSAEKRHERAIGQRRSGRQFEHADRIACAPANQITRAVSS